LSAELPAFQFRIAEVAPGDAERKLALINLDPEDRVRIAAVRSAVLDHLDDHVAAFFDYLERFDEAHALLSQADVADEVRRLKREHLVALVSGDYGREYVNQRFRLGLIYSRAALGVGVFMGAYHNLMASIGRQIMADVPGDRLDAFEHFTSLKKVAFFDLALIIDAMMADREQTILRQDNEATLQLIASNADLTFANTAVAAAHEALKTEVAEREAISQELVEANRLASLGALVAGIAHELNTPIGNALMVTSSFQGAVRELHAEVTSGSVRRSSLDRFIQTVEEAGRLLDSNLNRAAVQIRSFKQIAVDQTSRRWRPFNLKRTIDDAVRSCTPLLRAASVGVETNVDSGIDMEGYPGALSQLIVNLVENAVKHGLADAAAGEVRIVACRADEAFVEITVSDNGVGIPESLNSKVFGAFFTTTAQHGGTGLGLHIVKTIANGPLGGTIKLGTSEEGGAQFVVVLPLSVPHESGAPSPECV